jgi:hypothetical protein
VIALLAAAALAAGPQPVPFEVTSVDIALRTVTIAYEAGPCRQGHPQFGLREGPRAIRIAVVLEHVEGCTAAPEYRRANLSLRRSVGGRRITGGPRISGQPEGLRRRRAPRVLDLSAADAERALAVQGFRSRRIGRERGAVAFQSPLPRSLTGTGRRARTVRLTVGRNLFRARALDRCMERAGIRSIVRRPAPGDYDAPDLVLWLRDQDVLGFVGLYRDPARARERTPTIRRTARRIGGTFERRRHVVFVWGERPPPEMREPAHDCLRGRLGRPRA